MTRQTTKTHICVGLEFHRCERLAVRWSEEESYKASFVINLSLKNEGHSAWLLIEMIEMFDSLRQEPTARMKNDSEVKIDNLRSWGDKSEAKWKLRITCGKISQFRSLENGVVFAQPLVKR